MKIVLGSDHAGYKLKESIKQTLKDLQIDFDDLGTYSEAVVDYPDYAAKVAEAIAHGRYPRGILVCGSGIGMSITANKFLSVRAALCHDPETARLSRAHNDANVLILGGRTSDEKTVAETVKTWFSTEFEGGRHQRRIEKIDQLAHRLSQSSSSK
jgi:ribose 5-phosphate isomerase B